MMQQPTDPPAEKERTDQPVQQCDHTGIGIGTLQLVTEILQVVGRIALLTGTQRAAAEKTDVHHVNAKRTGRCQTFSDGSSTLVQSFKKVKNFKSPLFIDDLKFFLLSSLKILCCMCCMCCTFVV